MDILRKSRYNEKRLKSLLKSTYFFLLPGIARYFFV